MIPTLPDKLYIHSSVGDHPKVREILKRFKGRVIRYEQESLPADGWLITRQKGAFLKPCPGQKGYCCCNLWVLETGLGCPFDCEYCALQAYQESRTLILHANIEDAVQEILKFNGKRLTTGEFSDSLALEEHFPVLPEVLGACRKTGVTLELKTKSDFIGPLLKLDSPPNLIVGFSLAPPEMHQALEKNVPHPHRRIEAAAALARKGFRLSFHFDPILPGFDYAPLIEKLSGAVPEKSVAWISLGVFRFPKKAFDTILRQHPDTHLFQGEYYPSSDGKFRLFRPEREKLFKAVHDLFRTRWEDAFIYLCMEHPAVWTNVMGMEMTPARLAKLLDERAIAFSDKILI
jgi:spore photoproduct lyase